ncbi:hypothetical protein [Kineosporia sp. A_224]|uniref:hypothetical protein n=1 Tax=Kineosporia sp. A_224 TaxID=1962180 RepID=UPI00117B722E|nr:hypothetical protein [Kineosporia sp. A_224]
MAVLVLPLARLLAWDETRDDIARSAAALLGRPYRGRRLDHDAALSNAITAITVLCILCGALASVALWLRGDHRATLAALPAAGLVAGFVGSGALASLWMARSTFLEGTRFEDPSWLDDAIAVVAAAWVTYLVV